MFGASGETKNQIKSALNFDALTGNNLTANFARLTTEFEKTSGLKVANKIYLMANCSVKSSFNEIAQKFFHSEAESVDFVNYKAAAKNINEWVSAKTNKKIKNSVNKDDLGIMSRILIVNAIYFKGTWANKFDPKFTHKANFHLNDTEVIKINFMRTRKRFKYGNFEDLDAAALQMQFKNSAVFMLIILPNSKTGLPSLESQLNDINLSEISSNMSNEDVIAKIPKFRIEFEVDLNDPLENMGMDLMFSDDAEFENWLIVPMNLNFAHRKLCIRLLWKSMKEGLNLPQQLDPQ